MTVMMPAHAGVGIHQLGIAGHSLDDGAWCVVLNGLPGLPANAGAARTETASSAAEIVLNIVFSSSRGSVRSSGDVGRLKIMRRNLEGLH